MKVLSGTTKRFCVSFKTVADLILTVVRLLRRDMNGLVETAREALEPIEPWNEG